MRTVSAATLLVLLSVGCSRSHVEVSNAANLPIENIEIRVAGNKLSVERLDAGETRRIGYSTKTEETIDLTFMIQGTKSECFAGFYVSPPFEDEFTISISSDGKCKISRKPSPT